MRHPFSKILFPSAAGLLVLLSPIVSGAEEQAALRLHTTETVDTSADGGLRPVIGVQNIQVVRANKTVSPHADGLLHSYLHAPMLAYWKGNFYLEYLSGPRDEHEAPCITSFTTSKDGLNWSTPRTAFPAFKLPDGSQTISHQRMGFFVSPSGRLLILSFYGKHPSPNDGSGVGRAVREIHEDGSLGPVYFLRLNTHAGWTPDKVPFPLYDKAEDPGFVEACQALIANKLVLNQMWEEDRSDDGFYSARGRALSFFHRADGAAVGIWKSAQVALSRDEGKTWTKQQFAPNLPVNSSKYWGQATTDGLYALVFNPTTRLRHPLAVSTSSDGSDFKGLLAVHGELPDQRFGGGFKNMGPQYVRGIVEGNGKVPDGALWVTYSVNKEDIWISRIPVPIQGQTAQTVRDDFEKDSTGTLPLGWNCYSPVWAPVRVVETGDAQGKAVELRDEDPYDYARITRIFPETHGLSARFKVQAKQADARLEIELLTAKGLRPLRIAFEPDGHLRACHEGQWQDAGTYAVGKWITIELDIPAATKDDRCEFKVDGKTVFKRPLVFTDPANSVERLSFRTGSFRSRGEGGRNLPGADERVKAAVFLVDEVSITPVK